jgi:protein-S-isoprenylcysteine O-methyltransferase
MLLVGYAGLLGFLGLEASVRRDTSLPVRRDADDRGTTQGIVVAYGAAALLTPVVAAVPAPRLASGLGLAGLFIEAGGLLLRRSSMARLGRSYTRTIRTERAQALVDDGPYALVRHPGYLGSILVWVGFALASRSPLALALVGLLIGHAYQRRIRVEEEVLRRDIPGYDAYQKRTYRLVPFVW